MSATDYFTTSLPKRPEVNGEPNQVFAFDQSLTDFIINGIRGKYIAGIGTLNHNRVLQYLFNCHVYADMNGNPIKIVGNMSNKKGEFAMGEINIGALSYFAVVEQHEYYKDLPTECLPSNKLTGEHLLGTQWEGQAQTQMILVGTYFPVFSGTLPVFGKLLDTKVQDEFKKLGVGYESWGQAVIRALTTADDIDTVMESTPIVKNYGVPYLELECLLVRDGCGFC